MQPDLHDVYNVNQIFCAFMNHRRWSTTTLQISISLLFLAMFVILLTSCHPLHSDTISYLINTTYSN